MYVFCFQNFIYFLCFLVFLCVVSLTICGDMHILTLESGILHTSAPRLLG